jgi:hypothetical protein
MQTYIFRIITDKIMDLPRIIEITKNLKRNNEKIICF